MERQKPLRNRIRDTLKRISPKMHRFVSNHWGGGGRDYRITRLLKKHYHGTVLDGPFQGMHYVDRAAGSAWYPKILGVYESELHQVINDIAKSDYSTIIDIGCAEGYYAIGLGLKFAAAHVFAFDLDPIARALCSDLATKNQLSDRITVSGECTVATLNNFSPANRILIVSDCEGAELKLLDPNAVPWLKDADILVELHDPVVPGQTNRLVKRFESSHDCLVIDSRMPQAGSVSLLGSLSKDDQLAALGERNDLMQWAWMIANKRVS